MGLLEWAKSEISKRSAEGFTHEVTVYDPIKIFGKGGALESSGAEIRTPHHFIESGKAPEGMEVMAKTIQEADCYLVITPEYNHSLPPALSGLMGHFAGSNYAYKPSGIITYSPGPTEEHVPRWPSGLFSPSWGVSPSRPWRASRWLATSLKRTDPSKMKTTVSSNSWMAC